MSEPTSQNQGVTVEISQQGVDIPNNTQEVKSTKSEINDLSDVESVLSDTAENIEKVGEVSKQTSSFLNGLSQYASSIGMNKVANALKDSAEVAEKVGKVADNVADVVDAAGDIAQGVNDIAKNGSNSKKEKMFLSDMKLSKKMVVSLLTLLLLIIIIVLICSISSFSSSNYTVYSHEDLYALLDDSSKRDSVHQLTVVRDSCNVMREDVEICGFDNLEKIVVKTNSLIYLNSLRICDNKQLKTIEFEESAVRFSKSLSLENLTNLQSFKTGNHALREIEYMTFSNLPRLNVLSLGDNSLPIFSHYYVTSSNSLNSLINNEFRKRIIKQLIFTGSCSDIESLTIDGFDNLEYIFIYPDTMQNVITLKIFNNEKLKMIEVADGELGYRYDNYYERYECKYTHRGAFTNAHNVIIENLPNLESFKAGDLTFIDTYSLFLSNLPKLNQIHIGYEAFRGTHMISLVNVPFYNGQYTVVPLNYTKAHESCGLNGSFQHINNYNVDADYRSSILKSAIRFTRPS